MGLYDKIDLHMHTTVSDGTDTPLGIIKCAKNAGLTLFSVTDHDAIKGCMEIEKNLSYEDPAFIAGVEFSCQDECGKYHILGYGYDYNSPHIRGIVEKGHNLRMDKLRQRLDYLEKQFGIEIPKQNKDDLFAKSNPGKPHIANVLVKCGYVDTKENAIENYINKCKTKSKHVRPEEAITAIIKSGGIPVLAHPSYGRGDELVIGSDMDKRLKTLIGYGLKGVEAFYSGFSLSLQKELLSFSEKYNLYVTAGSDYHGSNKLVMMGDTNLTSGADMPNGLKRFLKDVKISFQVKK